MLDELKQRYEAHPCWQALDGLREELRAHANEDIDDRGESLKRRLEAVLEYVDSQCREYSPLISAAALDELKAALDVATASLANWISTRDIAHLVSACEVHADRIGDAAGAWPPTKDRYAKGTMAAAQSFIESSEERLKQLQDKVQEAQVSLQTLNGSVTEAEESARSQLAELRQTVSDETSEIERQTGRLDDALNGLQSTFATAEAARGEAHQKRLTELAEKAEEAARSAKAASDSALAEQIADGSEKLEELKRLQLQAEDLVRAVGLTATATDYGKYAEQQRDAANRWRWVAAGSFGAAFLVFVITLVFTHIDESTPWQLVAVRWGASLGLVALGSYAARESSQHRHEERQAKATQLDLAALDPFIVGLPESQQKEIKYEAARRLFVVDRTGSQSAPSTEN